MRLLWQKRKLRTSTLRVWLEANNFHDCVCEIVIACNLRIAWVVSANLNLTTNSLGLWGSKVLI